MRYVSIINKKFFVEYQALTQSDAEETIRKICGIGKVSDETYNRMLLNQENYNALRKDYKVISRQDLLELCNKFTSAYIDYHSSLLFCDSETKVSLMAKLEAAADDLGLKFKRDSNLVTLVLKDTEEGAENINV